MNNSDMTECNNGAEVGRKQWTGDKKEQTGTNDFCLDPCLYLYWPVHALCLTNMHFVILRKFPSLAAHFGNTVYNMRTQNAWLHASETSVYVSPQCVLLSSSTGVLKNGLYVTLLCRHNELNVVSNLRSLDGLLDRLLRRKSKKTWKLRVTGLCAGNSLLSGEFLSQRASNAENIPIVDILFVMVWLLAWQAEVT